MTTLFVAEWRKIRTVRSSWVLWGIGELLVIAGAIGLLSRAPKQVDNLVAGAVAHVGLVALFSLVMGIMVMAGEYRHRTVTETFLITPVRSRVVAAKLLVAAVTAAAFAAVGTVMALTVAAIWERGIDMTDPVLWRTIAGGIGWNVLFAMIGVGVGAMVRNLVGAIAGALAWIAVVEGIIATLVGSGLSRWLPFQAGLALGRVDQQGTGQLPQWGAAALLLAYTAIAVAGATVMTRRADIEA